MATRPVPPARSTRTAPIAPGLLAVVLMIATLAVVVGNAPVASANTLAVTSDHPTQSNTVLGTVVPRGETNQTRIISLQNTAGGAGSGPICQVTFAVPKGEGAANGKNIVWSPALSRATGWNVDIDNNVNPAKLIFTQTVAGHGLKLGDPATDFTVGFTVTGNPPEGYVYGGKQGSNPPTGYIASKAYGSDCNNPSPFTELVPVPFEFRVDGTAPSILVESKGAVTRDQGSPNAPNSAGNGRLDQIIVTFNEVIDARTFRAADFTIKDRSITKAEIITPKILTSSLGTGAACPAVASVDNPKGDTGRYGCTEIRFYIAEGFLYDTGDRPTVTYTAGTLADMAGNKMKSQVVTSAQVEDQANPILVSAVALHTDTAQTQPYEQVRVQFSESVKSSTAAALKVADLFYCDNPEDPPATESIDECNTFTPSNHNVNKIAKDSVNHPPTGAAARTDLLTFTVDGGTPKGLLSADVSTQGPDQLCTSDPNPATPPSPGVPASKIRDLANRAANDEQCVPIRAINVLGPVPAEVNIDSTRLTLKFNGPVSDASGDDKPVTKASFSIEATTCAPSSGTCGPTGVLEVEHRAGSDQVVLILDKKVTPTDVDSTPAYVVILPNTIKATGSPAENQVFVPGQKVPMRDATPPAVESARTIDADGNGVIDGLFLEFNEPVNDASFCDFDNTCYNDADASWPENDATTFGVESNLIIKIGTPAGVTPIVGAFQFDTDLQNNDRFGVLKWPTQNTPGPSAAGTGVVVDFTWTLQASVATDKGLFLDFASNPLANPMLPLGTNQLVEADGAPPVIVSAETVDSNTEEGNKATPPDSPGRPKCKVVDATHATSTCHPDPDGYLDAYRLTFSEPILESSFKPAMWKVQTASHTYQVTSVTAGNRLTDGPDDATINVVFDRSDVPDTDARPEITYTKPGPSVIPRDLRLTDEGLKDLAGVPMNSFGESAVTEVDRAVPAIVEVKALAGSNQLEIQFSEAVDDGAAGSLTVQDFYYKNIDNSGSSQCPLGASGLSSAGVAHTAGTRKAVLTLNNCLGLGDISKDQVGASVNSIRETQPFLDPNQRQFALNTAKSLSKAPDQIAPGKITDLAVDLSTANSVRLSWTAPGNDGDGNGKVTKYIVGVSTADITAANFDPTKNPATLTFSPDPTKPEGLVEPRLRQQLTITGLQPQTTYFFAVKALDDVPNTGDISNTVQNQTRGDLTLPEGQIAVSCEFPRSQPIPPRDDLSMQCVWNAARDPESEVEYHYQLNEQSEYDVKQSDPKTTKLDTDVAIPGAGTFYFHLKAFSGAGGQVETRHYGPIVVDYPEIPNSDLNIANQLIGETVRVVRQGDGNAINWTLPAKVTDDLPEGTKVAGFTVWRLQDGAWSKLDGQVSADVRNFTDDGDKGDVYLVTVRFAGGSADQEIANPPYATSGTYHGVGIEGKESKSFPTWLWIVIGVLAAVLIGGLIVFLIVRNRNAAGAAPVAQEGFVAEEQGPAGTDEASGLPTHDVKCPTCGTDFQAIGNLPLQITCPNCSSTGMLNN